MCVKMNSANETWPVVGGISGQKVPKRPAPNVEAAERRFPLGSAGLRSSTNENKACLPLRELVDLASIHPSGCWGGH